LLEEGVLQSLPSLLGRALGLVKRALRLLDGARGLFDGGLRLVHCRLQAVLVLLIRHSPLLVLLWLEAVELALRPIESALRLLCRGGGCVERCLRLLKRAGGLADSALELFVRAGGLEL
jgi:hypothetical protein